MKHFTVFAVSVCGVHRPVNEDNIFVNGFYKKDINEKDLDHQSEFNEDDDFIAAVFDGMGGQKDGEIASLKACEAVHELIGKGKSPDFMISAANDAICEYNVENCSNSGSTCVLLEHQDGRFRCWNVGDSRAYKISGDTVTQLSVDHTEKTRLESIGGSDGMTSRNTLTQHLGIDSEEFIIEPHVSEWITSDPGDIFLLCSDGLTGTVDEEEIIKAVNRECSIQGKALSLLKLSVDKGSLDNISIILILESDI